MDCSLPDFSVHGILQARILEWVCPSLLQGIFPTQGSTYVPCAARQILYCLSNQGREREHLFLPWPGNLSFSFTQGILYFLLMKFFSDLLRSC